MVDFFLDVVFLDVDFDVAAGVEEPFSLAASAPTDFVEVVFFDEEFFVVLATFFGMPVFARGVLDDFAAVFFLDVGFLGVGFLATFFFVGDFLAVFLVVAFLLDDFSRVIVVFFFDEPFLDDDLPTDFARDAPEAEVAFFVEDFFRVDFPADFLATCAALAVRGM